MFNRLRFTAIPSRIYVPRTGIHRPCFDQTVLRHYVFPRSLRAICASIGIIFRWSPPVQMVGITTVSVMARMTQENLRP